MQGQTIAKKPVQLSAGGVGGRATERSEGARKESFIIHY